MAISSVASNLASALFPSSGKTKASTALSLAMPNAAAGQLMGEKSQLEATRKEVIAAIEKVGAVLRLTGNAETKLTLDAEVQPTPGTMQERVDQAAVAADLDTAVSKFNSLRRDLLSALDALPSFSSRAKLTDKTTLTSLMSQMEAFGSSTDANRIKEAATTATSGAYNFSAAGNVAGTDAGRSEARRALSDLAATTQETLDRLIVEAQRIDMKLAGATAGLASSGMASVDSRLQSNLAALETALIKQQRRISTIGRLAGDIVENLDNPVPSSVKAAETLQQFIGKAETNTQLADAVAGFNELQDLMIDGLGAISTVNSKYLLDQNSLNATLEKFKRFSDDSNPDFLRQAAETAAADNSTFDFSAYGNADGTDNKRSEARRILNELRQTADQANRQITAELNTLAARLAGFSAAKFASGYGPQMGSAVNQAAQFDAARRQIETGVRVLNEMEMMIGSKAATINSDGPVGVHGNTLQDMINLSTDPTYRDTAVSEFNRIRGLLLKKLTGLPSIGGSILNDPAAAQAAGDKLIPYLEDQDGLLFKAATSGTTGAWDMSAAGNAHGTGDGRSVARRVLNELQTAVQQAKEIYSAELIQITAQAEAAQVAKTMGINALAGSSNVSIMSMMGGSTGDSNKLLAQSARQQLEASYQTTNSLILSLGQFRGAFNIDRPINSGSPASVAEAINEAGYLDSLGVASKLSNGVRDYNGKLDDLNRLISKMKSSNATTLIDKTSVNSAAGRIKDYLEGGPSRIGQTTRPDMARQATATTPTTMLTSANFDFSAAGNAAGTDGGRSEARRILSNMRDQTARERNQFALELINQDARLIGLNASSGLQAKQYQQNLQKMLSQDITTSSGASFGGLQVSGSMSRMKSFLARG